MIPAMTLPRLDRLSIRQHNLVIQIIFVVLLLISPLAQAQRTRHSGHHRPGFHRAIHQDLVPHIVTVSYTPGKPANSFVPDQALGAGVDGMEKGDIARVYTPANIQAMLSAGFKPLTYRLRTELGIEAWHWNPKGAWSDPQHQQGYWISDSHSDTPLLVCNGYHLPRRGNTIDQANNKDYSRLDDGDPTSFWKSNPYLDKHFTGVDNALHPQWIVIDLGKQQSIDTIRLLWGVPYAVCYRVEYWHGINPIYINENPNGAWKVFPTGDVHDGKGGDVTLTLAPYRISARFVRLMLTQSSETAPPGSTDVRDRLGYALREIYLGARDSHGKLHDLLNHGKDASHQTVTYVSSTDPWHRASDLDPNVEQPGFDRVFQSGLTNDKPVLLPVAALYDTPENAAAEIRFLRSRHYSIVGVEIGEEPDGQYILPEDYAALYIQWADALHHIDPQLKLGGPCFQTSIEGYDTWPDKHKNVSWLNRFFAYLKQGHHTQDFNFFSFEWYPFDSVNKPTSPQLIAEPKMLQDILQILQKDGLSRSIPWFLSEYGYSAFAGQPEVDMAGALLNAEIVAQFLTLGGARTYLYGYEPNSLIKEEDNTWGNLALFHSDDARRIIAPNATYYGARLLTREWALPGSGSHQLYPAATDIHNAKGQALVTAYAVHRPDKKWAILLINKDPEKAWEVQVRFRCPNSPSSLPLKGRVESMQYSSAQYVWHPNKENGYARPNNPPERRSLPDDPRITLPAYSLTILRGGGPD